MKIALTGGASGIGAATVERLLRKGHEIVIFDLRKPDVDCPWVPLDLMNTGSVDEALEQVDGSFDGLAFIAGIPPRDDNAAACLTVNTLSTCRFIEGFLPKLKDSSAVVSVASRAGLGWQDNTPLLDELMALEPLQVEKFCQNREISAALAYRLSKQAIIYWHQSQVAAHIGRLRFVTVSPAAVSTGILDDFLKAFGPAVAKNLDRVGRAGTPEEVSAVIAFLLSPDASWVNGIDIIIDGGMGALNLPAR